MSFQTLPIDSRPREKLLAHGAGSLADAELLALLLRTGSAGQTVLQLAQALLDQFGGLTGLLRADAHRLGMVKGLGPAKRAEIAAVLEIAQRALREPLRRTPVFDSPQLVRDYLRLHLDALDHEVFAVMFLDAQHRLITMETLFHGTLTQTSVYPREVVKRALELNAAAAILAHNHPSGEAEPSRSDELLTQALKSALGLIDVRVLDHFIIGAGSALSMAERGLM
ncbi:DNA repair protein RadC [Pelomonas sp. CA6]|uniref:RadC family protein n=1 Tax=Pelomonas sp. CA6 TaxID=2907999 RepID=UPI001F4C14F3|nr:DNA repair protein RadC [Pelomonas sp. CA6]MCH7345110.1 DNA repair protein RadC [Pelomonas sp. CA6]